MDFRVIGSSIYIFNTGCVHGNPLRSELDMKRSIQTFIDCKETQKCKSMLTITNQHQGPVRERLKSIGFTIFKPEHLQFHVMAIDDFKKLHYEDLEKQKKVPEQPPVFVDEDVDDGDYYDEDEEF